MASLSFRDRFYSPPVAHAVTSPSAILALGAGVAVGIVVTAPISLPFAVLGAIVGGAAGYGGRVALALPKKGAGEKIRVSSVDEPWRGQVEDAIQARTRFGEAVRTFRAGPMRDEMASTEDRVEEAVSECWRVAQQGQIVSEARTRINDREINWELSRAEYTVDQGGPNDTQARTIAALRSQLATGARMDALVTQARQQLALLNARLDESVTRAVELSVSNRLSDATTLGDDVGDIVTDLETLRMAIEDVEHVPTAGAPPPPTGQPGSAAGAP